MNKLIFTLLLLLPILSFSQESKSQRDAKLKAKENKVNSKPSTPKPQVVIKEKIVEVAKENDQDGDGIVDNKDKCPNEYGELKNEGCPKKEVTLEYLKTKYKTVYKFSDGLVAVELNEKWGFVNKFNDIIIPIMYDNVWTFDKGMACVQLDGKYGYINNSGSIVIPIKFNNFFTFNEKTNLAILEVDKKYALINKKGNIISDYYDNIESANSLPILVKNRLSEDRRWKYYYLDSFGRVVLDLSIGYEYNHFADNGLAEIYRISDGKSGYIDTKGNIKIPIMYDFAEKFSEDLASVSLNGKWGFINSENKIEIPFLYDNTLSSEFHCGLAPVNKNWKHGYIDKKGNVVIPFKFDFATNFYEQFCTASVRMKDGKWFIINKQGESVKD